MKVVFWVVLAREKETNAPLGVCYTSPSKQACYNYIDMIESDPDSEFWCELECDEYEA